MFTICLPNFRTDFASTSKLLFYTPRGNIVQLMDLSGDAPICNRYALKK